MLSLTAAPPAADRQASIITGAQTRRETPILDFILAPFSSLAGSRHARVAGLVWGNLQPSGTICYVAKAARCSSLAVASAALYCKCSISIHEGIYMHSQATLLVFIPYNAQRSSPLVQLMMGLLKGAELVVKKSTFVLI